MSSSQTTTLDVGQFMQDLRFSRYHWQILILCSLVTFFDGQDFAALAYALPYIRDDMGISGEVTGYVSAAAFLGQMIGSLAGSHAGDLLGRRPVIIACTIGSAIMTFAVGFAATPAEIIGLRFISGLTIGGLLAPVWALSIESMPKAMRATSVTIIMMGFSLGAASAGPIANWTAPILGWQGIFWVCGVLSGIFVLVLFVMLPESARWMVATGRPRERIVPALARFNPDFDVGKYAHFSLPDERQTHGGANPVKNFRELFVGALVFVTPLIWAAYFCSSFAIYLKSAYGVIFLENLGVSRQDAAWIGSIGAALGALGGVALLAMTERRGPGWIALAPLLAIPLVLLIGTGTVVGGSGFVPVVLAGMILVGGGHAAVISITSIYYPSAVRATGGGWASFMAKFAAVAAPIFGARFLVGRDGAMAGYAFTALCLAGIVICILLLAFFARGLQSGATAGGRVE
ncbi:MAG: MFS transporter [Gammaproteobacteria bacterium]|nr:MFS transporter [Gammaproteobacteria bacterium]